MITRRQFLARTAPGRALKLLPQLSPAPKAALLTAAEAAARTGDSIVLRWNQAAPQGVRDSKLGPPTVARALAIVHTCAYEVWAAYDHRAIGTCLGHALRRPPRERTLANKISRSANLVDVPGHRRVTDSRNREEPRGHARTRPSRDASTEDTGGAAGIRGDTAVPGFGTVRPGFKSRAPDQ